jgi:hypothetical protein
MSMRQAYQAAAGALEHGEHPAGPGTCGALGIEVGADLGEEQCRDRDQPLMAAFALGDEQPPFGEPQVGQPQPEDLAAAQPGQHHRRDHGPVAVRAQGGGQRVHLGRADDLGQRPGHPDQRDTLAGPLPFPPGRQAPRHRVHRHITAGVQEPIQPRHARQAPPQCPR